MATTKVSESMDQPWKDVGLDPARDNFDVYDQKTGWMAKHLEKDTAFKTITSLPPAIVMEHGLDPQKRTEANWTVIMGQKQLLSWAEYLGVFKFIFAFPVGRKAENEIPKGAEGVRPLQGTTTIP